MLTAKEIHQLHLDWADKQNKDSQAKELQPDRLGKLRGGSVGCIGPKGEVYGECPRKALARSWGYNGPELDLDTHLMFEGGRINETSCDALFTEMLGKDSIIPEGDPRSVVDWALADGRRIGGSPDAVLTKPTDKLLLEYKKICSCWTARKVSILLTPIKKHIIQAAHYMGVSKLSNGILYYRQDVNFPPHVVFRMDPVLTWPEHLPFIEYEGGFPRTVRPHVSLYDLLIDNTGALWIRHHTQEEYRPTLITTQGIHDFYKLTSDQESGKFLADKPVMKYPTEGKVDKGDNDSPCKYCPLNDICGSGVDFGNFKRQVGDRIRYDS